MLPTAIQIADKWHLLRNIGDILNSILQSNYTKGITIENTEKPKEESLVNVKLTKKEIQRQTRMTKNMELIEETKRLYASGVKQKEISTLLGISRKTIYRYLRRSEPTYSSSKGRGSILDAYMKEIDELFLKGTNSRDILAHIREYGYIGCESLVRAYLSKLKKLKMTSKNYNRKTTYQKLIKLEKIFRLFWRNYNELTEKNQILLNEIIQSSMLLSKIYQLVQSFREIIRDKNSDSLVYWINDNVKSEIIQIKKFAQSLKKDVEAVSNTLKYEYTNAVLEGHVNRLKNIKRMMYGRANFDLLRQRVLFQI